MSRSTQFIGLNKIADEYLTGNNFVPKMEPNPNWEAKCPRDKHPHAEWMLFNYCPYCGVARCIEVRPVISTGMFDEEIYGGVWVNGEGRELVEIEQLSQWSSGPMIFTCLLDIKTDERFGEWTQDAEVREEFNTETGKYWI